MHFMAGEIYVIVSYFCLYSHIFKIEKNEILLAIVQFVF